MILVLKQPIKKLISENFILYTGATNHGQDLLLA
jgi:hypothetical protein